MDKFEEAWKANRHVWESTKNLAKAMYLAGEEAQQAKVEELQRRNQMLNDNIKEQGQKLVYQNEVIETQAEKLLGLRDEKAELQKRVDAAELKLKEIANIAMRARRGEYYTESGRNAGLNIAAQLEQALKGDSNHE